MRLLGKVIFPNMVLTDRNSLNSSSWIINSPKLQFWKVTASTAFILCNISEGFSYCKSLLVTLNHLIMAEAIFSLCHSWYYANTILPCKLKKLYTSAASILVSIRSNNFTMKTKIDLTWGFPNKTDWMGCQILWNLRSVHNQLTRSKC